MTFELIAIAYILIGAIKLVLTMPMHKAAVGMMKELDGQVSKIRGHRYVSPVHESAKFAVVLVSLTWPVPLLVERSRFLSYKFSQDDLKDLFEAYMSSLTESDKRSLAALWAVHGGYDD